MGGRAIRRVASNRVLCGWLACWIIGASAQGNADGQAATPAPSALSQVVLQVAGNWDFSLDNPRERELWSDGAARPPFKCGAAADKLALDNETMAARKLELSRAPAKTSWVPESFYPNDPRKEPVLQVTNASLRVISSDSQVLLAKLEQPLPNGTTMEVPRDRSASINVEYDCLKKGRVMIELRLMVLGDPSEMCVQWRKACAMDWRNLQVKLGNLVAVKDGTVTEDWKQEMGVKGTYEMVTKLQLSASGLLRLRRPKVSTSQELLKVDIRGQFAFGEQEQDITFEVFASEPMSVSVVYTCNGPGAADVVLTLIKAGEVAYPLDIRWKKHCGETVYHQLQVWLKSDTYKNSTQVVHDGLALHGYMRPCAKAIAAPQGNTTASPTDCEASPLFFEVPPKDRRTSVELRVDPDAVLPHLKPPPDVSYNRKLMQVQLMLPRASQAGNAPKHKQLALQVKYTCFKDGVSVVGITLFMPGYKPIDVAWNKRCTEPKVHVGRAMTAPQAILVTVVISSIVALVCCLIFIFCGQDDKRSAFSNSAMGDDEELELTHRPRKQVPAARLGAGSLDSDDEGDVTFHD